MKLRVLSLCAYHHHRLHWIGCLRSRRTFGVASAFSAHTGRPAKEHNRIATPIFLSSAISALIHLEEVWVPIHNRR